MAKKTLTQAILKKRERRKRWLSRSHDYVQIRLPRNKKFYFGKFRRWPTLGLSTTAAIMGTLAIVNPAIIPIIPVTLGILGAGTAAGFAAERVVPKFRGRLDARTLSEVVLRPEIVESLVEEATKSKDIKESLIQDIKDFGRLADNLTPSAKRELSRVLLKIWTVRKLERLKQQRLKNV